jgi:hypothetical protein
LKEFHSQDPRDWTEKWFEDTHPPAIGQEAVEYLYDSVAGQYVPQIGVDVAIEKLQHVIGKRHTNRAGEISDLIDTLATVLQGRFVHNRFGKDTVALLKHVILRGDEALAATKLLKEKHLFCAGCRHEFKPDAYEAVSIRLDQDGDVIIYCAQCKIPTTIACKEKDCSGTQATDTTFHTAWRAACLLGTCGEKHKKPRTPPDELEEERGRSAHRPPLERHGLGDAILSAAPSVNRIRPRPTAGEVPASRLWREMMNNIHQGSGSVPPGSGSVSISSLPQGDEE